MSFLVEVLSSSSLPPVSNTDDEIQAHFANALPTGCTLDWDRLTLPTPKLTKRDHLPGILQEEKKTHGAELGVYRGGFSHVLLSNWPAAERFYVVDLWHTQRNYGDSCNVEESAQTDVYNSALDALKHWQNKTIFMRMYTSEAVDLIPDNSLDFIYVDARHDYCGCKEDMIMYWPKLKENGIMAGHDYMNARQAYQLSGQHWNLCMDGTINEGAVKGAVNEFAAAQDVTLTITDEEWPTWIVRKSYKRLLLNCNKRPV